MLSENCFSKWQCDSMRLFLNPEIIIMEISNCNSGKLSEKIPEVKLSVSGRDTRKHL